MPAQKGLTVKGSAVEKDMREGKLQAGHATGRQADMDEGARDLTSKSKGDDEKIENSISA